MSWLFGYKTQPAPGVPPPSSGQPAGGPPGGDPRAGPDGSQFNYSFDSTALERAAKAAKELERSSNAKQALELSRLQEITKQKEVELQQKQVEAQIAGMKAEGARMAEEERRKTLAKESEHAKYRADYQDQLARKRQQDEMQMKAQLHQENLRKQEESVQKQEALRKATIEHELQLRHKYDLERIEAEVRAKAKAARENRDVNLEMMKASEEEHRKTLMEQIRTGGAVIEFLNDRTKVVTTVGALTAVAVGWYSAKRGTGVVAKYVEARLGKPSLVRETSRLTPLEVVKHPVGVVKKFMHRADDPLKGVVLNGLARHSGLDYAILTGGDVAPMGKDGVSAIHKVFDWAESSRKGLVLFVDEADAFLRKRSTEKISEDIRAMLNAFLYRTGEQSRKFMLIVASNQPEQFDWAINDRLDELVEFDLPGDNERERILLQYFSEYIVAPASSGARSQRLKVSTAFDWPAKMRAVAQQTKGMSGRELSKLVFGWQASAYASEDGVLGEEIIDRNTAEALRQHARKMEWLRAEGQTAESKSAVFRAPLPSSR
ncbi:AAA domain-containing protein [Aphelenchoides fujianensis]|nr:AAA domain-containing protein [Aphelenchoides fujianensis]